MLKNNHFYHRLFRKYVVYFGSLFNDIFIERTDSDNNVVQWFNVPLAYGPKHSWVARLNQDPEGKRETAIVLPRMSFEIMNITYDSSRKLAVNQKIVALNAQNSNQMKYTQTAIPFNITFGLTIYTKNVEENLQIVEQILPFFAPEWTSSVNLIPELNITKDIPVAVAGVTMNDRYEHQIGEPRFIMTTIQFVMKAELYGPINNKGVIKRTTINLYDDDLWNTLDLTVTSNNDPAFTFGDIVYQTANNKITAQGIVKYSSDTLVQLMEITGTFKSNTVIYAKNSPNRANTISIIANSTPMSISTITPALTANGTPTSNSQISISIDSIKASDDYGISINVEDLF